METTTLIRSKNFSEIKPLNEPTLKTGDEVFDKWLSNDGGFVLPGCILLSGDSGSGKTTIVVNLMKKLKSIKSSLYSREMKDYSVKQQTKNVTFDHDNAFIADKDSCPSFEDYLLELETVCPKVIIIDSLQAITEEDYTNMSSEDAESYVVKKLRDWAERTKGVVILICHNTKDGDYKGGSGIKQYLDAHAVTRVDLKTKERRILWEKNRKGPIGELFYNFEESGVVFYTNEQWVNRKNSSEKPNFDKIIFEIAQNFLDSLDKNDPKYKGFKKEYNARAKEVEKIEDVHEYVGSVISLISEVAYKHGFAK